MMRHLNYESMEFLLCPVQLQAHNLNQVFLLAVTC